MWGNSRKRGSSIETLIGRQTTIEGDVRFTGGLHVDGEVVGNVVAEQDSGATLSVSEYGRIVGDVHVPHMVLNGGVEGNVYSGERLELSAQARVTGDVYYNLIEMASGASVNGKLVHEPAGRPMVALAKAADGDSSNSAESVDSPAGEQGAEPQSITR